MPEREHLPTNYKFCYFLPLMSGSSIQYGRVTRCNKKITLTNYILAFFVNHTYFRISFIIRKRITTILRCKLKRLWQVTDVGKLNQLHFVSYVITSLIILTTIINENTRPTRWWIINKNHRLDRYLIVRGYLVLTPDYLCVKRKI